MVVILLATISPIVSSFLAELELEPKKYPTTVANDPIRAPTTKFNRSLFSSGTEE